MKKWDYLFGTDLPDSIKDKLEEHVLRYNPLQSQFPGFEKNAFSPDGFPVDCKADTVYPALLYRLIGTPISAYLSEIEKEYRSTASVAALKWLEKVLGRKDIYWYSDGLHFEYEFLGEKIKFCFPTTTIAYEINSSPLQAAVIPLPDSHNNDPDWESGMIPQYAEQRAQLLMWCHHQYAEQFPRLHTELNHTYLVRIKGNLAVDNTIRTVTYNPAQAERLVAKICKTVVACRTAGKPMYDNLVEIPKTDWKKEREQDLEDAYRIEDPALYEILQKYMEARSTRKTLESQAEAIKEQMHTLAITIASTTATDSRSGRLTEGSNTYSVTHTPKRSAAPTISADLLRQLAPDHIDAIRVSTIPRGRITIEAL